MKLNQWIGMPVLALIVALAASGCKHSSPGVTKFDNGSGTGHSSAIADVPPSPAVTPGGDGVTGTAIKDGLPTNERGSHAGWKEDAGALAAYTVHFDYDSTVIKESEKSKLEAIATQLKGNASAAVRIEGHCDERGTEEYNRSLGEKRSLALREALTALGVDSARLDTISFGEDRPISKLHDNSAYSQNRRGEFVQLTPPQ